MSRFFILLTLCISSISSIYATTQPPARQIASELNRILIARSTLDASSGSGDSNSIRDKYLYEIDQFAQKYTKAWHTLALRPTVDRSLIYRLYIQDYTLSCEITALRIILDRLGIIVSEGDILASIPQLRAPYSTGGIWGDPEIEFVGYYTGGQTKKTGYGVYESPLAKYAQMYSLRTRIINQASHTGGYTRTTHIGELLSTLDDAHSHVILWGDWCTDPEMEDGFFPKGGKSILRFFPLPARNRCYRDVSDRILRWQTPSGQDIVGLSGEHAYVLLGYIGRKNRPTHIIVWDTYTGRHVYPYSEWMRKWSNMQYRSLIISQ